MWLGWRGCAPTSTISPSSKRRELELIVKILFEEFEDALALATQPWKKQGRILKIILFGSHARVHPRERNGISG